MPFTEYYLLLGPPDIEMQLRQDYDGVLTIKQDLGLLWSPQHFNSVSFFSILYILVILLSFKITIPHGKSYAFFQG